MNTVEDGQAVQVLRPTHFGRKCFQRLLLQPAKQRERLDDPIFDSSQRFVVCGGQDIEGQLPVIRALLDKGKLARSSEAQPHFSKLSGKDRSKDRPYAD